MTKIKKFEKLEDSDTITIPGLAELSQRVGENTSDIKHLKQTSKVVNEMKLEMAEFKVEQKGIKDQLSKLDRNDARISNAIETSVTSLRKDAKEFKYWLLGTVGASLVVGLTWYNGDKSSMEDKIQNVEKFSIVRHKETNSKLDKITDYLIPKKK